MMNIQNKTHFWNHCTYPCVAYFNFVFRIIEHLSVEATILQVTNNEAIA